MNIVYSLQITKYFVLTLDDASTPGWITSLILHLNATNGQKENIIATDMTLSAVVMFSIMTGCN